MEAKEVNRDDGRPVSIYDNLGSNPGIPASTMSQGPSTRTFGFLEVPSSTPGISPGSGASQEPYMSTTVPVNLASPSLAGRHQPTRSSLRHSRMIVMNRTGKVPRKYQPRALRSHRLATILLSLQLFSGLVISSIALWFLIWAPNLNPRDTPYWSGIPLMASGILGLFLVICCTKEYPGMPFGICIFSFKVAGVMVSAVASVACFCASVFATLHFIFLYRMTCAPAQILNTSCVCYSGTDPVVFNRNSTFPTDFGPYAEALAAGDSAPAVAAAARAAGHRVHSYIDLNCPDVENVLSILLLASVTANAIGGILATWYVFLHWTSRYAYLYSEMRSSDSKPIVITNKMDVKYLRS